MLRRAGHDREYSCDRRRASQLSGARRRQRPVGRADHPRQCLLVELRQPGEVPL